MNQTEIYNEFDRQLQTIIKNKYAELVHISEDQLIDQVTSLKTKLPDSLPDIDIDTGKLPFVIVLNTGNTATEKMMDAVNYGGKTGVVNLYPIASEKFITIDKVSLPNTSAYLLMNIDRGRATVNITPEKALQIIEKENRSPLTIDEGLAIMTHFPQFLIKNNCFSLLASRCGDQRVPAIWISEKRPKLGWCWDRNPHTWLGSASCATRI